MLGFFTIAELVAPSRSFVRVLMIWNFLRQRYKCPDSTVFRVKYKMYHTAYYHQQAWSQLSEKALPYIAKVPALERALEYPKKWFLAA